MIRLLLVDDQRLMREGLRTLLEREADMEIVGLAANGAEAVISAQETSVDVILMDIRMPVQDGISATEEILQMDPKVKVLMLTTFDDLKDVAQALSVGAVGYLLKDMPVEVISSAIRTAFEGGAVLPPQIVRSMLGDPLRDVVPAPIPQRVATEFNGEELTDREMEVLRCLAEGMSNREIAMRLFVTEGTVKNHVSSLIAKLGLRDRTQAALFAVRHGFGSINP